MLQPFGLDYDVVRLALLSALRWSVGLDQNQAIMAEPESSEAPRPDLPYVDLKIDTPMHMFGRDIRTASLGQTAGSPDVSTTYGPRSMKATFTAFANTHEQAQGLMGTWQTLLQSVPVQEMLLNANVSVLSTGDVADVSALLDTGYEGRSELQVTLGAVSYLSRQTSTTLTIESAIVVGQASGESIVVDATTEDAP